VIDLHAHILPGLDDGPRTMAESVALAEVLLAEGVTHAVAAPHMFDGVYEVPCDAVTAGVRDLRTQLARRGLPLHILPGADVRVDPRVLEAARSGQLLSIGAGERYLLLELPDDILPPRLEQFLFDLQMAGLGPILTHPERNREVQARPGLLENLIHLGCFVQVSAQSLMGVFGQRTREAACRIIAYRLAHLLASDCHDLVRRPPRMREALAVAASLVGVAEAEAMVCGRPAAILAGDRLEVEELVEPADRRGSDLLVV